MRQTTTPAGKRMFLSIGLTLSMAVGATACTDQDSDTGTVVSITDGDTFVASINGKDETIRLLNIDTPETKDPNRPVECLGNEATDFLADLLPVGSNVRLMYDVERTDQYDRTLAAVFTPEDQFVSAEIARAGLGDAVIFGENKKFYPPVEEAQNEAKDASRGIFNSAIECTIPAQIEAAENALESAASADAGGTSAAAAAAITLAAGKIASARAVHALIKAGKTDADVIRWAALSESELSSSLSELTTKISDAEGNVKELKAKEASLKKAEEAAAKKAAEELQRQAEAAAAEQARVEAAAAAQAKAEADAKAQAAEAERVRNLPPVYVPPPVYDPPPYQPPPVYDPPPKNPGNGPPGYTGPRCYLPGGKTYRPC